MRNIINLHKFKILQIFWIVNTILEKILGRELPGEVESLFFCVQTGIGVGIIAFIMGRLVERKKWTK